MGSSDADHKRSPPEIALADKTNRSLFATATLIAVAALFACWFGTREIINGIVNYEGREAATHWAEAFAHTLEVQNDSHSGGPIKPYSKAVNPDKFRALDNAIFDGKIVAYRIYNPQGVIVATSNFLEIGNNAGTPGMRHSISEGSTNSHLITTESADTVSRAIASLIWVGDLIGAIQIDVDVSTRAAQLNRLRYLAFAALVGLLAAVVATLGFVAVRTLRRDKAAEEELTRNVRQHRRLLDEASDSMVIHNMKRVLYANTAAAALLANMGHELRTPLNAIIGFSEFLKDQAATQGWDNQTKEFPNDIRFSGQRLLATINDVLEMANLEAGRIELDESTINLSRLLQGVLEKFHTAASDKGISADARGVEQAVLLRGDYDVIRRAIGNIVSNAIKFTQDGGVYVSAMRRPSGDIEIAVTDTGVGMTQEEALAIIEPFRQADTSLS